MQQDKVRKYKTQELSYSGKIADAANLIITLMVEKTILSC